MLTFKRRISPEQFWDWFRVHERVFYKLDEELMHKRFSELTKKLSQVHPQLTFEFSTELINGKREFVVSADGLIEAFPKVIELVESAPLDKNKWTVYAFRQRSGLHDIEYEDVILKPEQVFFTYEVVERAAKREIDCEIFIDVPKAEDETIGAVFIFLDTLIGEFDVATKLGSIVFRELNGNEHSCLPIEQLVDIVDSI